MAGGGPVRKDIAAGRLVPILQHLDAGEPEAFHAIHIGQGGPAPSRANLVTHVLSHGSTRQGIVVWAPQRVGSRNTSANDGRGWANDGGNLTQSR